MPNKVNIAVPPVWAEELREVYSYLWKTVEQLNVALNSIDEGNLSEGVREKLNRVFALADDIEASKRGSDGLLTQLGNKTNRKIAETDESLRGAMKETENALRGAMKETENALRDQIDANADGIDQLEKGLADQETQFNETVEGLKGVYAPISHDHESISGTAQRARGLKASSASAYTDLNDFLTPGQYWVSGGILNNPVGDYGMLLVFTADNNGYNYHMFIDTKGYIYTRFRWSPNSYNWTAWRKHMGTSL